MRTNAFARHETKGTHVLILLSSMIILAVTQYVTVTTPLGGLRGECQTGYCSFKGVYYAEDTSGNNRYAPPIPKTAWAPNVLDALSFVPECPQKTSDPVSENCLALNIWAPSDVILSGNQQQKYPVFFWIHGGAFEAGTGAEATFWGDFLANTSSIVLVTINYRLGPLGFLNTPNLSGNYGLLDQQLAMKWVQENIQYFGGDSDRVTIGGQSAGAMSVTLHMLIENSTSLYNSVIIESNPAGVLYRTPQQNIPYAEKFASAVNCSVTDIECLRGVPVDLIQKVELVREYIVTLPLASTEFLPWSPVIDGEMIAYQPIDMIEDGLLKKCPVLIGNVMNETNRMIPDIPIGNNGYNDVLKAIFSDNYTQVLEMYPDERRSSVKQLQALTTDLYFVCPTRKIATSSSAIGNPTYLYVFTQIPSDDYIASFPVCNEGPCHSAELPFVFHSQYFNNATWTAEETTLSFNMMQYWASFMNDVSLYYQNSLLDWPLFNINTNTTMMFNEPLTTEMNYRSSYCDFWDSMGYIY